MSVEEVDAESGELPPLPQDDLIRPFAGLWSFSGLKSRNALGGLATILLCFVVGAFIFSGRWFAPRGGGGVTACKSNLKNIGTAMEMYSTDWAGAYPTRGKAQLTPNYLKTIPECPAAGTDTYQMVLGPEAPYNTNSYQDFYFIECRGENHTHVSLPPNYPQYNGVVGLIER